MSTRLTLEGMDELESALNSLPSTVRRTIMADAIRPAAELVRAAVEARAPRGATGKLAKSIVTRETQVNGEPSAVVVPNRKRGGGGAHAHLVEYGTAPHEGKYYGRPSQHPGTSANPFWEPAVNATEPAAMDLMERAVGERLESEFNKSGGGQ